MSLCPCCFSSSSPGTNQNHQATHVNPAVTKRGLGLAIGSRRNRLKTAPGHREIGAPASGLLGNSEMRDINWLSAKVCPLISTEFQVFHRSAPIKIPWMFPSTPTHDETKAHSRTMQKNGRDGNRRRGVHTSCSKGLRIPPGKINWQTMVQLVGDSH